MTETLSIADYAYILANSQVAAQGPPGSLKNSEVSQVRQFLEGLPDGPVSFHYPGNNYIEDLME